MLLSRLNYSMPLSSISAKKSILSINTLKGSLESPGNYMAPLYLPGELFFPPLIICINRLLDGISLPIIKSIILNSLEKNSNLFELGLKALVRLKDLIYEWPDFCQALVNNKVLEATCPPLYEEIRKVRILFGEI